MNEKKQKKGFDENEFIGSSYLITFYQQIGNLTMRFSEYRNLMLEIQEKHPEETLQNNPPSNEYAENLKETIRQTRYSLTVTNLQYESLQTSIPHEQEARNKTQQAYEILNSKYMLDITALENYCLELNKYLLGDKITTLINTAQNLLSQIYDQKKE